jgi:hypothetical protein
MEDRRYIDRLSIPGTRVFFKKTVGFSLFRKYKGPYSLSDITKCTISLTDKIRLPVRTDLNLKLIFPDKHLLNMKGSIRGFEHDAQGRFYKTVIQFNPFGNGKKYNSFRTKKRLERLLTYYQQTGQ